MSRIDNLIAKHCPEGVDLKPLGEVGTFIRGNGLQKSDLIDSGFPAIHYGQIHTTYGVWIGSTVSFVDPTFATKLRRASTGDVILATTSEDDEAVGKATAWLGAGEVAISGDAFIYRHSLDPKYVSYFLTSKSFHEQKRRFISGAKVRRISGQSLSRIVIPVPPVELQQEIVGILDSYSNLETELATELELELEARRKQYAYYRDSLMSFSNDGGGIT